VKCVETVQRSTENQKSAKWRQNTPVPGEPRSRRIGFVATLISFKDTVLKFRDNAVFCLSSPSHA
jgi:hypothetical protein